MSARWIRRAAAAAILLAAAGADAQTQPAPEKRPDQMTLEELRVANQRRALGEMARSVALFSRNWPAVIERTCQGQIIDSRASKSTIAVLKPRLPVASCVAQNLALIEPIAKMIHPNAMSLEPTSEAWTDAKRMKLCIDAFEFSDQPWPGQPPFTRIEAFPAMLMECVSTLRYFVPAVGPIAAPVVVKPIALGGPNPGREAHIRDYVDQDLDRFKPVIDRFCGTPNTRWGPGADVLRYSDHGFSYGGNFQADRVCRDANFAAVRGVASFIGYTQHREGIGDSPYYEGQRLVSMCRRKLETDYGAPLMVLPCIVTLDRLFEMTRK